MQQPRRALHVREQQRHDACWEIAHHTAPSWGGTAPLSSVGTPLGACQSRVLHHLGSDACSCPEREFAIACCRNDNRNGGGGNRTHAKSPREVGACRARGIMPYGIHRFAGKMEAVGIEPTSAVAPGRASTGLAHPLISPGRPVCELPTAGPAILLSHPSGDWLSFGASPFYDAAPRTTGRVRSDASPN